MKQLKQSWIPLLLIILFVGVFFISHVSSANGAASHIVISQIQVHGIGTGTANQEFVELYNPTNAAVTLTGWRLRRETASGSATIANLVASMSGTIASHGYYLIGSPEYAASISADIQYNTGNHLTADNTVLLYSDAGVTLVDKVGMGAAADFEGVATINPPDGGSIMRTVDDTGGNGQDTNNNANDFQSLGVSTPRNSSVIVTPTNTPILTVTPSSTPSATPSTTPSTTPSVTPSSTPSATPSLTPSPSTTPSLTPSPTPSATPTETPSPTMTPSVTPTNTPSPTLSMGPTITITPTSTSTPTVTPSITMSPTGIPSPFPHLVCSTHIISIHVLFFNLSIPVLSCTIAK